MGSTHELRSILLVLSGVGAGGIPGVAVKCADIGRNTDGEGSLLGLKTDAEVRKRGERTGLDTLVVHAVNDGR